VKTKPDKERNLKTTPSGIYSMQKHGPFHAKKADMAAMDAGVITLDPENPQAEAP